MTRTDHAVFFTTILLIGRAAFAQEPPPRCSSATGPAVVLAMKLGGLAPPEDVEKQLVAGLGPSGIRVCSAAPAEPTTTVNLERQATGQTVRITVVDTVTTKTVQRDFDLTSIPEDSRAVALALYVEELLQASWAELALRDRPKPARAPPPPPEVVRAVAQKMDPPPVVRRFDLAVGGSVAGYSGGQLQLGPQVQAGFRPLPYFEGMLRFGYRVGPAKDATFGAIASQTLLVGGHLFAVLPLTKRLELRSPHGLDALRVTFVPEAALGVTRTESLWAMVVSHGLGLRVGFTSALGAALDGRFQWVAHGAEAGDGKEVFTAVSGVGGEVGLSFDVRF